MTIEAIQSELSDLSREERRQVLQFLQQLEFETEDEVRLAESVQDFKEGRTVAADTVHRELRERIANR